MGGRCLKTRKFNFLFRSVVLFVLCPALLTSLTVAVQAGEAASGQAGDGVDWVLGDDGHLEIMGSGYMNEYPSNDTPWSHYTSFITELTVYDGVRSVSDWAFADCSKLVSASLPDSLEYMGAYAFQNATSLVDVTLPSSLYNIPDHAFDNCPMLRLDSLPYGIDSIGPYAFWGCKSLALQDLPDSVTSIGAYAFHSCEDLALTTLPSKLKAIPDYAFGNCPNLALQALPEGITSIGYRSFYRCDKLSFFLSPQISKIDASAFQESLAPIRYHPSNEVALAAKQDTWRLCKFGDANTDDEIDVGDAQYVFYAYTTGIRSSAESKACGDVNNNGVLDLQDAQLILLKILENQGFPVEAQ